MHMLGSANAENVWPYSRQAFLSRLIDRHPTCPPARVPSPLHLQERRSAASEGAGRSRAFPAGMEDKLGAFWEQAHSFQGPEAQLPVRVRNGRATAGWSPTYQPSDSPQRGHGSFRIARIRLSWTYDPLNASANAL